MGYVISFEGGVVGHAESTTIDELINECLNRCQNMEQNATILEASSYKIIATVKYIGVGVYAWLPNIEGK